MTFGKARMQKDTDIWQWLIKISEEECQAAAAYSTTSELPSLGVIASANQSCQVVTGSKKEARHPSSSCVLGRFPFIKIKSTATGNDF